METVASKAAARGFISALYDPDEHVAILAVERGDGRGVHQRIIPAADASAGRFQGWLRHLNARGHDVFIGMNPMQAGTRGREKADVARVRRLQLDLDSDGPNSLRRVLADVGAGRLPAPAIVVRSSQDHYQVLWHTAEGWSPDQAEDTMARLALRYDGDNVNDVSRCMRLPGFRNKKPDRDDAAVTWTDYGGPTVRPDQFAHLPPATDRTRDPGRPSTPPRAPGAPLSQSERDWASVRQALRDGADPGQLVSDLAQQRQDKPDPDYYARRTVQRAGASLGSRVRATPEPHHQDRPRPDSKVPE